MDSYILDLYSLTNEIGMGRYTLEECRQIVRDNAVLIEKTLAATFTLSLYDADARNAFAILDNCKALITRRISIQRRGNAVGFAEPDIIVGLATTDLDIDNYLMKHPALSVCSMYLGLDGQVWCVFARSSKNHRKVQYDAIRVVDEESASDFLGRLKEYMKSLSSGAPDFTILRLLLQTLGAVILPTVMRLGIRDSLILIPHRQLHILPLHSMQTQLNGRSVYLDELVKSISYSSSLFEMYSPRIVAGREGLQNIQARMLAVLDLSSTDLSWLKVEHLYFKGLARMGFPIDIVTDEKHLPTDLSKYIWVSWGGHAKSDPTNWGGSFLALGQTVHSASKIALEWTCSFRPWVLLSACESAVDSAEIAQIDEYCGLDMAFYIAGAWGTFATMWPVRDEMATLADIFLTSLVLFGGQDPPEAITTLSRRLRTGNWKLSIQNGEKRFPNEMRESFRMLQQLPKDIFSSIENWGVFRAYGISYTNR